MTEKNNKENQKVLEFVLKTDGTKVKMDLSKFNAKLLFKCRQFEQETVNYILSEICLFDGEKIPAPEMLEWDGFKVLELEDIWTKAKKF